MSTEVCTVWDEGVTSAAGVSARPQRNAVPEVTSSALALVPFRGREPGLRLQHGIEVPGRTYWLAGTFVVRLTHVPGENVVFVSHDSLPVHGYGETLPEAIDAFCAMFDHQWRVLVEADAAQLTAHARGLAEALRGAVRRIEPALR